MKKQNILYLLSIISCMALLSGCAKEKEAPPPSLVGTWTLVSSRQIETRDNVQMQDTTYYFDHGRYLIFRDDRSYVDSTFDASRSGSYSVSGSTLTLTLNSPSFISRIELKVTQLTDHILRSEQEQISVTQFGEIRNKTITTHSR